MKPKVLVYADSRAKSFDGSVSYVDMLSDDFDVDNKVKPVRRTMWLDFLDFWFSEERNYRAAVVHLGIVDWSPKPISEIQSEYQVKKVVCDRVFGAEAMSIQLRKWFPYRFRGEHTNNLYSLEMMKDSLLPLLIKVPRLLFVGVNSIPQKFIDNGERPENINLVLQYSIAMESALWSVRTWEGEEVDVFTFDGIHPNKEGHRWLAENITREILHGSFL